MLAFALDCFVAIALRNDGCIVFAGDALSWLASGKPVAEAHEQLRSNARVYKQSNPVSRALLPV